MNRRDFFKMMSFAAIAAGTRQMSYGQVADYLSINHVDAGVPYVKLNNGVEMPRFGIGTFAQPSNEVCRNSVLAALNAGYRHIDTAHAYNDERGVGQAIKDSGVNRKDIWVTSKLWASDYATGDITEGLDKMLQRLQTDYIDLLYIHQPIGKVVEAWEGMIKAYKQGKIRALGISNFDYPDQEVQDLFHEICDNSEMKPQVLQIECNPYAQRLEMRKKIEPYQIQLECWFPLGGMMSQGAFAKDPVIQQIAKAHNKTTYQVVLRWHIQEGFSVIPGSKNPEHIKENIDIFDFELTDQEMTAMRGLNKEQRFYNSPYSNLRGFVSNRALED